MGPRKRAGPPGHTSAASCAPFAQILCNSILLLTSTKLAVPEDSKAVMLVLIHPAPGNSLLQEGVQCLEIHSNQVSNLLGPLVSYVHPVNMMCAHHYGGIRNPEVTEASVSSEERDRCVSSLFQQSTDHMKIQEQRTQPLHPEPSKVQRRNF